METPADDLHFKLKRLFAHVGRKSIWAVYLVLALEFAYMFSPLYLYGTAVLNPTYGFLARWPATDWLVLFFYNPQVRFLIPQLGALLAAAGLALFLAGWIRILRARIGKTGLVVDGLYSRCRHPQYLAAMVAGFGLLLALPRYLFIVFFVGLIFIYRGLSRREETECLDIFGEEYEQYAARTPAFVPARLNPFARKPYRLMARPRFRGLRLMGAYLVSVAAALGIAAGVERATRAMIPATYVDDMAVIQLYPVFNFYHLADFPILPLGRGELLNAVGVARDYFEKYRPEATAAVAAYLVYVEPKPDRRPRSTVEFRPLLEPDRRPRDVFDSHIRFGPPLTAVVDRRWGRVVDTGERLGDSYAPILPLPGGVPIDRARGHYHPGGSHR